MDEMQLDAILKAVDGIRPILLEEAPKCELERRVTQRAVDTLRDCGLFKLLAPKRFGGFDVVSSPISKSPDQQLTQYFLGKAAAIVEASRDTLHRAMDVAYEDVKQSGKPLFREAKIRLQLATSIAGEACAEATRLINDTAGTSAIRTTQPYEHWFRVNHTLLQHTANLYQRPQPPTLARFPNIAKYDSLTAT